MNLNKITEQLQKKIVLVSDGAWGTRLFELGLKSGACPEEWNLKFRDSVFSIAKSYVDAGSDIISTNSFGASRIKLAQYDLSEKVIEINRVSALISRDAAGNDKLIFGSMGPTGKFLITGEVTAEELYDTFAEQAGGLVAGGVDAILLETFYDPEEALIAVKSLKENFSIPIVCSFTYNQQPDGSFRTLMGNSPVEILNVISSAGADLVGSNCGTGFADIVGIAREYINSGIEKPFLIQANAGLPEIAGENIIYSETPEFISPFIEDLISMKVSVIGGCCGTTPDHIRVIRRTVDSYLS